MRIYLYYHDYIEGVNHLFLKGADRPRLSPEMQSTRLGMSTIELPREVQIYMTLGDQEYHFTADTESVYGRNDVHLRYIAERALKELRSYEIELEYQYPNTLLYEGLPVTLSYVEKVLLDLETYERIIDGEWYDIDFPIVDASESLATAYADKVYPRNFIVTEFMEDGTYAIRTADCIENLERELLFVDNPYEVNPKFITHLPLILFGPNGDIVDSVWTPLNQDEIGTSRFHYDFLDLVKNPMRIMLNSDDIEISRGKHRWKDSGLINKECTLWLVDTYRRMIVEVRGVTEDYDYKIKRLKYKPDEVSRWLMETMER